MRIPLKNKIFVILSILIMMTMACNFSNSLVQKIQSQSTPTATETPMVPEETETATLPSEKVSPIATLVPSEGNTPVPGEPEQLPTREPSYLDNLNSYRLTFNYKVNGKNDSGNEISQSLDVLQEANNPSQSFHIKRNGEDVELEAGQKDEEIYALNDKTYVLNTADSPCALFYTNQDYLEFISVFMIENIFPTIEKGELIKKGEVINGIPTDHYTLNSVDTYIGSPSSQKGDIWYAQDGGYVVRFTGEAEGNYQLSSESGNGNMTWEYNLTDINQVNEIPFPSACQETQSAVMDYPIPANAINKESDTGYLAFSSPDTMAKLTKFYKDELGKKGWTVSDELSDEASTVITLQKDQKQIQVEITPGDQNLTNVVITDLSQ
jgi:hypothetical protein